MTKIDPRLALAQASRSSLLHFIESLFPIANPGSTYLPNWHIEAIARRLEQCLNGTLKRLIITLPPRHLKSYCASVALPAYALGHDPTTQIICASYASSLADKFSRATRDVMRSSMYQAAFPATKLGGKDTEAEFETTDGGTRLAVSVGSALTGRGADIIVVDDPLNASDADSASYRNQCNDWFRAPLLSRLNSKQDGVVIILMQRLHADDLVGHLLAQKSHSWTVLNMPAIATHDEAIQISPKRLHYRRAGDILHPAREPLAALEKIKSDFGSRRFSAYYQQSPVPEDGNLINRHWFRSYATPPLAASGTLRVHSWDTAMKAEEHNDYSVCTEWLIHDKAFYLMDVFRERLDYPNLRRRAISLVSDRQPNAVLVEDHGSGTALIQDLREAGTFAIAIKPHRDKFTRMATEAAKIEGGQVHLPKEDPWLADFLTEILAFPSGKHDDQVDSVSQFLHWAGERQRSGFFDADFGKDDPQSFDHDAFAHLLLGSRNW